MRKWIVILAGVAVLGVANYSIYSREQILRHGEIVLLQLAPVDPRSLMQGDYMALRFQIMGGAFGRVAAKEFPHDGAVVLTLNEQHVASFHRFDDGTPLASDEVRMVYRIRNGQPKFATNAFFFQEGDASLYESAEYGQFRVATNGESILTAMRDEDLKLLGEVLGD